MSSRGTVGPCARRAVAAALPVALILAPAACRGQRPDRAGIVAAMDRTLSEAYPANGPGAAILVSRGGNVLLRKGYGLANVERGTPVTPETVFRIASVTKTFTATAVLMLADQGRLALDSPVTAYLPSAPSSWRGITVRHLLSHSSGLAEYLDRPDFRDFVGGERTLEELIGSFRERPASFSPGERDTYSNSNYILLGAIIERVTGTAFAAFVGASIFDPLGMRSTACNAPLSGVSGLAEGYEPSRSAGGEPDWSRLVVARPYTLSSIYAAGGCVSTVDDISRFHDALLGGRLLRAETLAHSFAPVQLAGGRLGGTSYGGWQLDRINGRGAAMKGGSMPGTCTWFVTVPDEGLAVILLTNRSPGQPRCGGLTVRLAGIAAGR